jgi:hypothetical protein
MADGTDTVKTGADGTPEKVTPSFDDKQQEFINTLFDKRFAKISEKHNTEKKQLEDKVKELEAQLAAAGTKKDPPTDEDPDKKQFKSILENEKNKTKLAETQAQQRTREAEEARSELLRTRKEVAMQRAAQKQDFHELEVVLKMTWDAVEYDEDTKQFVIKENGVIKQNSSLQPMTLEEYYNTFASQRPYLVKGDIKGGAGSSEGYRGTDTAAIVKSKADLKTPKAKSDFITKFGLEKYEALPLKNS